MRDALEKTGADPDSRRELVVLAAQLINVNEQLIEEKRGEMKDHVRQHEKARARSKSRPGRSSSCRDGRREDSSKRDESRERLSRRLSFHQVRGVASSASDEED